MKGDNMAFEPVRRYGATWEDAQKLDQVIQDFPFNTTGKKEHDFETGFATALMTMKSSFNSEIITQIDKSTTVQSVYCFGKSHRPDLTLGENGIAVEIKFITYDGLKTAIGQGHFYRLRYKFVVLILVISEDRKTIFEDLDKGKEKDLEDTLEHLAETMNIFTYVVPAFSVKTGSRKCIRFFT